MAEFTRARSSPGTVVVFTVAGAVLLVLGGFVGVGALAAAVVVLQLAVAASWHDLLRAPGATHGSLVGLAAGVVGAVTLAVGSGGGQAGPLAAVAVGGFFLALLLQLVGSTTGPARLSALNATTALVIVEVLAATWVAAWRGPAGSWVVAAGVAGAVVAVLALAAAGTSALAVGGALLLGAGVGAALGAFGPAALDPLGGAGVAAAGAVAALCGTQVRRLAGRSARTAPATVAALPLAVAGPATFIAARILVG